MEQELLQLEQEEKDSNQSRTSIKTSTNPFHDKFTLVQTNEQFEELCEFLDLAPIFAYDTETNGNFDRYGVELAGISFACGDPLRAWYVPFNHFDGDQLSIDRLATLGTFLRDPNKEKICHNAKFDEMVLARYGIEVQGFGHDTVILTWLYDENRTQTRKLKLVVEQILGHRMTTYEEVVESAPKKRGEARDYDFRKVPLDIALDYAADDSYQTYRLFFWFKEELTKQKVWPAYENVEGPFGRVLRNMEARGVHVDKEELEKANVRLPQIQEDIEAKIYEKAGKVFNVGSGPQLGKVLFEELEIGKNVPTTKSGQYATDKNTLKLYAGKNEIVADVLRRKKIQKTHSTFVEGTQNALQKDGKLRPNFNGCGTVTGRLSCSSPNLQNIEGDEVEEIKVRNFYIPSDGFIFVVADYAQIEYRLMAHFSRDRAMLDAFASEHDFHEETARKAFNIPADQEVVHGQRFIAKSINFGVGYGRGPKSLAETLECSMDEATDYIDDYYKTFSGLAAFKKHVVSQARKQGYIRTLTGRKRRLLPDIRSDSWKKRGHAERQAFNTKIQGSAADIIKMAMISLEPKLEQIGGFMVIQIHDELVIEVPKGVEDEAVGIIKHTMENPLKGKNPLRLPMVVEPSIVTRWGDAKD